MHIFNDLNSLLNRKAVTASYTHGQENMIAVTFVPSNGVQITLAPPASFVNVPLTIKLETTLGSGVNIIASSGSIEGSGNYRFSHSYESVQLYSNGSNYYRISSC